MQPKRRSPNSYWGAKMGKKMDITNSIKSGTFHFTKAKRKLKSPETGMVWSELHSNQRYCGFSPSIKRPKACATHQFSNSLKQMEQTKCQEPIVFGVNNASNAAKSSNFGGEAMTCNSPQRNIQTLMCSKEPIDHKAVARRKIKEVVDLFEDIISKNLKQLEAKPKSKFGNSNMYVVTAKLLQRQHKSINADKQFGSVPGIEVGDSFRYRAELVLIGLHCQFISGIDYVEKNGNVLATSIVHSGRYTTENIESLDVLVYSGQGGNPNVETGVLPKDQKLERGNLALKNNIKTRTPVRVIWGSKVMLSGQASIIGCNQQIPTTSYTYVGLYLVDECWQERGPFGKLVFRFLLRRIPGQPDLVMGKENKPDKYEVLHNGASCANLDISQGKENMPIRVVNDIDNVQPPFFNYITHMVYPNLRDHSISSGCKCTDGCYDSRNCFCAARNGGESPFYRDGRIVKFKPLVYECGPSCKCQSCPNRVSQCGIKIQLEVFRTRRMGWGVRSRNYIPRGSFICEYVGEVFKENEVQRKVGKEKYLFDIGSVNDENEVHRSCFDKESSCEIGKGFTIDAMHYGNVGRFLNRSCAPNVCAQYVLYDHNDKSMPHVMLFAMKNIPPLEELTYSHPTHQVNDVINTKKDEV